MKQPIISVSGLRGVIGESLSPELVIRYVCAFADQLPPGPIVVTRDGRATGPMLVDAIRSGLSAVGRDVLDADVAATPTTGVLVRTHQAAGGIQISASHNPAQYNGIKLFGDDGCVISDRRGKKVLARYLSDEPISWRSYEKIGAVQRIGDTTSAHLALIEPIVNVELIRRHKFTVLLDANHGCGSVLGIRLLEHLGCDVQLIGGLPDGQFAHLPEPTAENLQMILDLVANSDANVGFCQDPDADRLAVIDESGRYLGEEYTLAMCVAHVLESYPGPIVTNCSTSQMSRDIAKKKGLACHYSAVGEANVTHEMRQRDAVFGGEGNGGVIDPRVGYVRDSFVGMALLLDAMAARDLPISKLADELPRYEIEKTKVTINRDRIAQALDALKNHYPEAEPNWMDGLRLDWPGRWLLVRASNTEPIVRIIAEAETRDAAQELCRDASAVLNN